MPDIRLAPVEARFADLIWKNEPIASGELAKLAAAELSWKRTTSYTILKRLVEKGLFRNEGGTVTSCLSREEYESAQSERFIEESFSGSLPAFLAAFSRTRRLNEAEIAEMERLIESMRKES